MRGTVIVIVLVALAQGRPKEGEVVAESLAVFCRPDDAALVTGELRRGQAIVARGDADGGWLAIGPPQGSFGWVDATAIEPRRGDEAMVVAPTAVVRAGADEAKMPGAVSARLRRGQVVRLLDRPPLVLRQADGRLVLKAIRPTANEVRFVRADGVRFGDGLPNAAPLPATPLPLPAAGESDPRIAGVGAIVDESGLPESLRSSIIHIEVEHRAALRLPAEQWRLEPIRRAYERLLAAQSDEAARRAIRARIDRVSRQEAIAKAAAQVVEIAREVRGRHEAITSLRARAEASSPSRAFDVEGLLLASSKQVDGRRVYMLVGPQGETSAYLSVPPGLEADRLISRRVGVRGTVRYNESLKARHVEVDELESSERATR